MALDALWYFVIYHFVVDQQNINLGFIVISPHIAALIIVFPITFLTGFYLNRYVVFRAIDQRKRKQIFRYGISVVGSILLNYALLKIFVEACGIWPTIAKVMTTIIVAMYSYIAARYFSFNTHYEK
jgi:putative flippase GtrA